MSLETAWLENKRDLKQDVQIVCFGEALVELSQMDFRAGSCALKFAGDTMNTAVYLKRCLGEHAEVSYMTKVGCDAMSDQLLEALESHSLAVTFVGREKDRLPGIYAIEVDAVGERRFRYWRNQSAAKLLFEDENPGLEALSRNQVIYFSGISLAILPLESRKALIEQLAHCKSAGQIVVFDTNYRPALWESAEEARHWYDQVWAVAKVALPSIEDLEAVYGSRADGDYFAHLSSKGVEEVVLRKGEAEPALYLKDSAWAGQSYENAEKPLLPAQTVVDTTGAGDSFNAAYMAARIQGEGIVEAVFLAHELARRVIGFSGAIIDAENLYASNA